MLFAVTDINTVWMALISVLGTAITSVILYLGKKLEIEVKKNRNTTTEVAEVNKKDIKILTEKTDEVHKTFNSELEKFKEEMAKANAQLLEQAVEIAKAEKEKIIAVMANEIKHLKETIAKNEIKNDAK